MHTQHGLAAVSPVPAARQQASTPPLGPPPGGPRGGRSSSSLCLVHAHPDDESIITGGVVLRAKQHGHRVTVVTCTGGEEGEIHNLDETAARPRLAEIREAELRRACAILGVDRLELLGYRDSGMAGSAANRSPDCFHQAPLSSAADRLAAILGDERPQVVVTYSPDGTYGHPDHVKAHRVTVAALDRLGREGWRPAKTYWHVVPRSLVERLRARTAATHPAMRAVGFPDGRVTTEVDVHQLLDRKRAAVAAHVSQNPVDFGASLVGQVLDAMGAFEHFRLSGSHPGRGDLERDLFAGLPEA